MKRLLFDTDVKAIRDEKIRGLRPDIKDEWDLIDAVPTADLGELWIPVTERLPELDSDVLCRLKGFCYGGRTQVCRYRKADKYINHPYFDHHRNGFPVVTHWMPLPTPPKED